MGKLQTGAGNLIGQAEKLKELGAKTTKSLPKGMLIDEGLSLASVELVSGEIVGPDPEGADETRAVPPAS